MPWYVMVCEGAAGYSSMVGADDKFYDGLRERFEEEGLVHVLGGRKGIPDSHIEEIGGLCNRLVQQLQDGEAVDVEQELHRFDIGEPEG